MIQLKVHSIASGTNLKTKEQLVPMFAGYLYEAALLFEKRTNFAVSYIRSDYKAALDFLKELGFEVEMTESL